MRSDILCKGSEVERLGPAYALGEMEAAEVLIEAMRIEAESNRDANLIKKYTNVSQLNAGIGLCIAGEFESLL